MLNIVWEFDRIGYFGSFGTREGILFWNMESIKVNFELNWIRCKWLFYIVAYDFWSLLGRLVLDTIGDTNVERYIHWIWIYLRK